MFITKVASTDQKHKCSFMKFYSEGYVQVELPISSSICYDKHSEKNARNSAWLFFIAASSPLLPLSKKLSPAEYWISIPHILLVMFQLLQSIFHLNKQESNCDSSHV